jgi:hypothetical protein
MSDWMVAYAFVGSDQIPLQYGSFTYIVGGRVCLQRGLTLVAQIEAATGGVSD